MVEEWRSKIRLNKRKTFVIPFLVQVLAIEARIQQNYEDDVATLVIKKITLEDNGEYLCRATNEEGSDTSSAQVTVKGTFLFFVKFIEK